MRTTSTLVVLLAACTLTACDSGDNAAPSTLAPTSSTIADTSLPDTAPEDTTAGTAGSTVPDSVPDGTIELTPGGPWRRVDSAPGVSAPGLVYELMDGLWVYLPVEEDIEHGITWVLNEKDLPVIEAYLQARLVFFKAIASAPMSFDDPGWMSFYVDGGTRLKKIFEPMGREGLTVDLSAGVVLRPVVVGEGRTSTAALISDCTLDGAVLRNPDGSIADGATPGVAESGIAASLAVVDGGWKLDRINDEVAAVCD